MFCGISKSMTVLKKKHMWQEPLFTNIIISSTLLYSSVSWSPCYDTNVKEDLTSFTAEGWANLLVILWQAGFD